MVQDRGILARPLAVLLLLLVSAAGQSILAQAGSSVPPTTNSIPPNLFLTDGGGRPLFWYRRSGERLIELSRIEEAQRSRESRPASEDPEGHWGPATNGFQLSLRFEKEAYTNGEPVVATMLVRNVSNVRQRYAFSARVSAAKSGSPLKRKDDTGLTIITSYRFLHPQTQARYQETINHVYDLTPGEYTFWAESDRGLPSSGQARIVIRN
jgi:hypothetical protein